MTGNVFLSILMLAAFVLAGGGLWMMIKGANPLKGMLMLMCSAVLVGNVLVWTL